MSIVGDWLLTAVRAAIHRPTGTAVVADLHLGYAEARRRAGDAVPATALEDALAPLCALLVGHGVRRLVIAGDLFEDGCRLDLAQQLLGVLQAVGVERLAIVSGNHDRCLGKVASVLSVCEQPYLLGDWQVVHGDSALPAGRVVQGHLHPCLRLPGLRRRAACYLLSEHRLILPAYSPEAAGMNVLHCQAWGDFRCHVIAGEAVLDFGELDFLRRRSGTLH